MTTKAERHAVVSQISCCPFHVPQPRYTMSCSLCRTYKDMLLTSIKLVVLPFLCYPYWYILWQDIRNLFCVGCFHTLEHNSYSTYYFKAFLPLYFHSRDRHRVVMPNNKVVFTHRNTYLLRSNILRPFHTVHLVWWQLLQTV